MATTIALLICACGGGTGSPAGQQTKGVELPTLPPVDGGVFQQVRQLVQPSDAPDLPKVTEPVPSGLSVSLDKCELRAPGQWVISGAFTLPPGTPKANIVLAHFWQRGDTGEGASFSGVVTGSGHFAVAVDRRSNWSQLRGTPLPADPTVDDASGCDVRVVAADVPVAQVQFANVKPTFAAAPLTWTAPAGSLQAHGVGAHLGDERDARLVWAYLTYGTVELPFNRVWVPRLDSGATVLSASAVYRQDDPCTQVHLRLEQLDVIQSRDCRSALQASLEQVDGAPGFAWAKDAPELGESVGAVMQQDGFVVAVTGRDRAAIAQLAASLEVVENLAVLSIDHGGLVGPDLDKVVATTLSSKNLTERARLQIDDGLFVVGTAQDRWGEFTFRQTAAGWYAETGSSGGGGNPSCGTLSASGPPGGHALAIVDDPQLHVAALRNGEWVVVQPVNGVWYEPLTSDLANGVIPLRFEDSNRVPVNC